MLEDIILGLLKRWRPTKYKGIGWRGGLLLALYWSAVCSVAAGVGWDILGITISALGGALVGYRLEGISGAIAVAIFSGLLWAIIVYLDGTILGGIVFGAFAGYYIATRTRE